MKNNYFFKNTLAAKTYRVLLIICLWAASLTVHATCPNWNLCIHNNINSDGCTDIFKVIGTGDNLFTGTIDPFPVEFFNSKFKVTGNAQIINCISNIPELSVSISSDKKSVVLYASSTFPAYKLNSDFLSIVIDGSSGTSYTLERTGNSFIYGNGQICNANM